MRVWAAVEPLFSDRVPVSKRGRPPRLAAWPLGRPPGATGSSPRSSSRVPAGGPAWPHGASRVCLRKHANTRHGCSRCLAGFPTRRPLSPAHPQGRAAGGELLRKLLKVAQGRAGATADGQVWPGHAVLSSREKVALGTWGTPAGCLNGEQGTFQNRAEQGAQGRERTKAGSLAGRPGLSRSGGRSQVQTCPEEEGALGA